MSKHIQPHRLLLQIGASLYNDSVDKPGNDFNVDINSNSKGLQQLTKRFSKYTELKHLHLDHEDILILACAWYQFIIERNLVIDPLELLGKIYSNPSDRLSQLNRIVNLLKNNVFYTEKKTIKPQHLISEKNTSMVHFHKYILLEHNICFHRSFVRLMLGETEDVNLNRDKSYHSNKEFLSDWFAYADQLKEFSWWDFLDRNMNSVLSELPGNELLKALEWKERIDSRLERTEITFPLMDIVDEYKLDENETVILAYLVKEDMEGNESVESEDVIKLISRDQHEMYQNRAYLSVESKLVRNGLVEISENVFFRTKDSDIRAASDITRRIIMRTPVNDDERLAQVVKGDDLFTLLEPTQTFDDLVLPPDMIKTIRTGINQYKKNIDGVLNQWDLYDGRMKVVGRQKRKLEPGLLMLFYGRPGTGKTFAAGAIANVLGKKLLVSDISRVQSKWVGDSEKNVRRMFSLFERVVRRTDNPPVLLLNEADQFLTSRLGNTDTSVDIMYNTLQNLFLEAFEHLRGILIATTNLKGNLDTAFSRRFHLKLEFPLPGIRERAVLWKLHLPESIPGASDIDVYSLAETYPLTGGQINIIVKNACTESASRSGKARRLRQVDLEKYCEIEVASTFDRRMARIGFG